MYNFKIKDYQFGSCRKHTEKNYIKLSDNIEEKLHILQSMDTKIQFSLLL